MRLLKEFEIIYLLIETAGIGASQVTPIPVGAAEAAEKRVHELNPEGSVYLSRIIALRGCDRAIAREAERRLSRMIAFSVSAGGPKVTDQASLVDFLYTHGPLRFSLLGG